MIWKMRYVTRGQRNVIHSVVAPRASPYLPKLLLHQFRRDRCGLRAVMITSVLAW
jgi:hypothetical protein